NASDRNEELKKAAEKVEAENLALVEDIKALTEKLARSERMVSRLLDDEPTGSTKKQLSTLMPKPPILSDG
ncbi:hypothetical protein MMC32_008354, partial [Xylographa parallela]|nr:hypothetical protein [Xylographa parallela]